MAVASVPASSCAPAAVATPTIFGAEVLSVTANLVQNFTREVSDQLFYNHPSISVKGIDYCNITVTYTHPGQNDTVNVEAWLPMSTWNGRLLGIGGGGYIAGRFALTDTGMAGALAEGYAATTTDAGLGGSYTPDPWALASPGNVNLYALQNLASAIIGKALVGSFYGQPPAYSYWSGCSQGGRQGFMLAQRYPDAYDGIAASAPALNWGQFIPQTSWAQVKMDLMNSYPYPCEFDALTTAAIEACDPLDGVTDGLVSDADACGFDPFTMVGKIISCSQTGQNMTISNAAIEVANATWTGPRAADGGFLWYGPNSQARLTGEFSKVSITSDLGYAMTSCNNETCVGVPTGLGESWLQLFVEKNPAWNYTQITSVEEYTNLFHASVREFDSIVGTSDPDLSQFRSAGGKIITYHGLADGLIPTKGTTDYYDRALRITPDVRDFFRYFQVPGLGHCSGGNGGQPTGTFQALVDWVERGVVPASLPVSFNDTKGIRHDRILCPYPEKARLKANTIAVTEADSFECSL
ncbi:tannase and feruloyl esterase [Xylariaceae sp. FL0662B]|nr:tannase and feruloyl esterase [Xylariaceae sp. FL0662B]